VTGRFLKGLGAALAILIVGPAGGCHHPRSAPEDATAAEGATATAAEVSPALIGKQITIRGTFSLRGKFGADVALGNQQVVYLVPRGSFTWGKPYSDMEGKLVAATGTLRYSHAPDDKPTDRAVARPPDFFYFEAETTQVRMIDH
jgi:hypothetical protein